MSQTAGSVSHFGTSATRIEALDERWPGRENSEEESTQKLEERP